MNCRNCGAEITGSQASCINCGAKPTTGSAYCPSCGGKTASATEVCTRCGTKIIGKESSTLPILAHILGLLTGWLGPLIILLATNEEPAKNHARMALNWQLSFVIYALVSALLALIFVGFVLLIAISILDTVFCIIAAVKAERGELWKYPVTIPFLKVQPQAEGIIMR